MVIVKPFEFMPMTKRHRKNEPVMTKFTVV